MKQFDLLIELLRAIYTLLQQYCETAQAQMAYPPDTLEEWLDKEGVKRYLKIENSTYYRWVKQGKLKPRGNVGEHRYFKSDLKELLAQRKLRKRE